MARIITLRRLLAERAQLDIIWLLLSVAPLVNKSSEGSQLSAFAMVSLAFVTAVCACRPSWCTLEGLPHWAVKNGAIASTASDAHGVVALLSRYMLGRIGAWKMVLQVADETACGVAGKDILKRVVAFLPLGCLLPALEFFFDLGDALWFGEVGEAFSLHPCV